MIFLTSWAVLMAFFVAICVASGIREKAERKALISLNPSSLEPKFLADFPTPETNVADLSLQLKSS